ncbi:MAG: hypothetical protein ACLU37_02140 [Collinsella sp.]
MGLLAGVIAGFSQTSSLRNLLGYADFAFSAIVVDLRVASLYCSDGMIIDTSSMRRYWSGGIGGSLLRFLCG